MKMEQVSLALTPDSSAPDREQSVRFSHLVGRLLGFKSGRETFYRFNPELPGPWVRQIENAEGKTVVENDYKTFRNSLLKIEEDVRIYSIAGHALKLVVKESYALILDELRQIRLDCENPELSQAAQAKLAAHPYGKRALPEDFLAFVDELPESGYFTRVLLLDESNIEDLWVRQLKKDYNSQFISSAAVEANGDLLFFKRELEEYLRTDLFHEWCHRLAAMYPELELLFRKAILLEQQEQGWYVPSSYALTDFGEHWAVYGERMLAADGKVFEATSARSATRAVIWMRALKSLLASLPAAKSSIHAELLARCLHAETTVLPVALLWLEARMGAADAEQVESARALHAELSRWSG